ncbi:hypothetical protein Tsubulata_020980 [Turnera subulata]|uniref:Thiaminase-2/PQQC domain-containing protein n=1 Tax=Turnera subulata TaxID=218843 RepID=A0A9Q0FRW8_9ROSI|nr:hypothetical protein Tsubulata_020980 [Turnera subulata]
MSSSSAAQDYTTTWAATHEDSLAFNLWTKCSRESFFALYTPFVVCLASGNLDKKTFEYYLYQDIDFLEACIKVIEQAITTTEDEDAKKVLSKFKSGDESEIKRLKDMLDPNTKHPIHPATKNYEQFLLDTVSGKIEGHAPFKGAILAILIFGAMMPCWRLYAALGQKILDAIGGKVDDSNPYKAWIESNGSKKLEESTRKVEQVLNKLCATLNSEQKDVIEKLYRKSMVLEVEFFLAPTLGQSCVVPLTRQHDPAKHRLLILSDFERTCTPVESSAVFADMAIKAAQKSEKARPWNRCMSAAELRAKWAMLTAPKSGHVKHGSQISKISSAEMKAKWGFLFALHEQEYEQCIESIMTSEKEEYNYEAVQKTMERFSVLERRANNRVIESGVLEGLRLEDIKQAGRRQLEFKESTTTGNIIRGIESPIDKLRVFNNILKTYSDDKDNFTIYIGDSVEDLLCLLQADIGIVIGPSSSLQRVGDRLGVLFAPLFPSLIKKQKETTEGSSPSWKKLSGMLYTVSSWAEIDAFILGW